MSLKIEAEQLLEAQRHFAMQCNNKAWSIAEGPDALLQSDELLNLAHAAAFHWEAIGKDLDKMRASMLLANVHAILGMGASAMSYAQQVSDFFLAQASVPDWELAFVHTIHARACACAGDTKSYADSYVNAQSAIELIADPEDKAIVLITFEQLTKPA